MDGSTDLYLTHSWGQGKVNHNRVALINATLKDRGYRTWFDSDRMHGNIPMMMANGIDKTQLVLVFVTAEYRDKVNGDSENDNCKLEFQHALGTKSRSGAICVVMEPEMRDPSKWGGILGFYMAPKLYVDMCDLEDEEKFATQMDMLCSEVEAHGVVPSGNASPNFTKCRYDKCTTKSKVLGKSEPQPRWYHVSVVVGDQVVVLGGRDEDDNTLTGEDVWSFDIANTAWKCHKTTGDIPTSTVGSTGWLHRGCVHLFGGTGVGGWSNAVHQLDTSYNWTLVKTTGTPPSPRRFHASWLIEDRVFVFGGECDKPSDLHPNEQYDGAYNNQLHTLQLDTMTWTHPVVTGRLPTPRSNCAHTVVGGVAYLFGGWGDRTWHNDLYRLETEGFVWSKITTTGELPSERCGCTMTCMSENSLMICGGYGGGNNFSDVWLFDVDDREWKEVETDNMRGCYVHTTSITRDKQIFLFGGQDGNDKKTNEFGIMSFT